MNTTLKSTLAALSVAILTALAISSCETKQSETHSMGHKDNKWPMANKDMPGNR